MPIPSKEFAIKTLSDITRLLQLSREEDNPLAHIVHLVRTSLEVDVCSLYILEKDELVMVATDGLELESVGEVRMPVDKGLTGLVAETLEPVVVKEAKLHPRYYYFPKTREERFESFAGVPLMDRQQLVGVLTIQTKGAQEFPDTTVDMLQVIAYQIAGVIRNLVTLEATLKKSQRKKPRKYTGIGASPGFVIGPSFVFRPQLGTQVISTQSKDPELETLRLKKALREAGKDLVKLERQLLKKLSKKESDIFNVHRMILKDRSFRQKLLAEIKKEKNAEGAILQVVGDYVRAFSSIEDKYLQDRVVDLEDLAQRLVSKLVGTNRETLQRQGILVAERLTPSETALLDPEKIQGIVTAHGGQTSHVAILARSLGIPAIMGIPAEILDEVKPSEIVIVDGDTGNFFVNPPKDVLEEYEKLQQKQADRLVQMNIISDLPAETKDGRKIHLDANIGMIHSLAYLRHYGAEGVGLYRTEFPFMVREKMPTEDEQYEIYKKIMETAEGLPITFRTLDAGGDKPIPYLQLGEGDSSPMGYRSIRLYLKEPEILKTQLKALYRASVHGPLNILIPMVAGLEELREVRKLANDAKGELKKEIHGLDDIPIGIMIEVPSAVQLAHLLIKEVDFFSIGTNDLIQFTLAIDRNDERVMEYFEPFHPAVIRSLHQVVQAVHKERKWVSICGEMAGDRMMTPLLIGLGFDRLSMIPANIPIVKKTIRSLHYGRLSKEITMVLELATAREVREHLASYTPKK